MSAGVGLAMADVEAFAEAIEQRFGHQQDSRRADELRGLLERRMRATGVEEFAGYRKVLGSTDAEWEALAPLLTVPETYFFRMPEHFEALAGEALPKVIEANRERRVLRMLSAGCASGEEVYTLRILLEERFPELAGWRVELVGVDLSEAALGRARVGVYSDWSLRATSAERRAANFSRVGKQWRVDGRARAGVSFRLENLLAAAPAGEAPYDVIFCRNVLIYFSEGAMREVISRLTQRLVPNGYLFLGPAESLRGVSRDFHLCHWGNAFFYRRKLQVGTMTARAASPMVRFGAGAAVATRPPSAVGEETWFESIRHSSERLAGLMTGEPRAKAPAPRVAVVEMPLEPVTLAAKLPGFLDLVQGEQFAAALAMLESGGQDENAEGVRLLRASMLTNLGRYPEAEAECRRLLTEDELNTGAHFLLGMCREQSGELPEAEKQMMTVTYLDPGFSMAHVHRGLIARRREQWTAAADAFRLGLRAVESEDMQRLALFGGGFSREGLRQVCLRELARLDGKLGVEG